MKNYRIPTGYVYILILSVILVLISCGSEEEITWINTYGEAYSCGRAVVQTLDKGYAAVGDVYNDSTEIRSVLLIRVDENGGLLWENTLGAGYGYDLKETADGGFILTGQTPVSEHDDDILLIKTDSDGDIEWQKTFGRTNNDYANSVCQTNDGGYVLMGTSATTFPEFDYDIIMIRTDASGNAYWQRLYNVDVIDVGYEVRQTEDGGFITVGLSGEMSVGSTILTKTNEDGYIEWTQVIDDPPTICRSVCECPDGGYLMAGEQNNDCCCLKFDSQGDQLWVEFYPHRFPEVQAVDQSHDDGYIFVGTSDYGRILLLKIDDDGSMDWEVEFSEGTECFDVKATSDGGYILVGNAWQGMILIKTNSHGEVVSSED